MSTPVVLDELSFLRLRTALQAKELFEIRLRQAASELEATIREAFTKAGLDPDKMYQIDVATRTATLAKESKE